MERMEMKDEVASERRRETQGGCPIPGPQPTRWCFLCPGPRSQCISLLILLSALSNQALATTVVPPATIHRRPMGPGNSFQVQ